MRPVSTLRKHRECNVGREYREARRYATEHAYQLLLMGDLPGALSAYKEATRLDEGNLVALHGVIHVQILQATHTRSVHHRRARGSHPHGAAAVWRNALCGCAWVRAHWRAGACSCAFLRACA